MFHKKCEEIMQRYEAVVTRKNEKSDFYNGIYDRYKYPVLTRDHIPPFWKYDMNPETNPYFMERLGVNAVFNSGAIELNGKFYLVARVEGNDRKSFFAVAESDNGIDGFRFWDYPISRIDDIEEGKSYTFGSDDEAGPITTKLYNRLRAIQLGDEPDTHNWVTIVE